MPRLTIYREGEPVREQVITRVVTALGRHTDNDVVLDDLALSRFHARLEKRDDHHVVVDLGSQNGVYVNGQRISGEQILQPGDRIGMGRYVAVYDQDGARKNESGHRSGVDFPAPLEPESPAQGPSLMLLYNGTEMERFPLAGQGYVIGRSHRCDIVIGLLGLSRRHARVYQEGAAWMVEDLGSQNGTYVNDARINGPQQLREGDVINFFEYTLVFHQGEVMRSEVTAPVPTAEEPVRERTRAEAGGTQVDEAPDGLGAAVMGATESGTDEQELEARSFEAGETELEDALPSPMRLRTKTDRGPADEDDEEEEDEESDEVEEPSDPSVQWPNERETDQALMASTQLAPAGRLEVRLDKRLITEVPLDRAALRIGSDARCDVALPPLPGVASWHLVLVRISGAVVLMRIGSAMMPRVGGRPVCQAFLQDGDRVELGRVTLIYRHR
ncbi:MAG: FHA domain-containing protein [Myxococcota bacterium]